MTGTVKFFIEKKGYGFITGPNGEETFFHVSALKNKSATSKLNEGTKVSYDVTEGKKGDQAVNVELV